LCRRHDPVPTDVGEKDTLGRAAAATDEVIASAGAIREPTVVCALESVKITNIAKTSRRIKRGVKIYDQKRTIEYAILWSMTI
jgi:Pyruvate/2-oxoacid:ferredoxin oxidoreductase gamma subunit